jgi:phosphoenolpyruvate-protein phosphotransferase
MEYQPDDKSTSIFTGKTLSPGMGSGIAYIHRDILNRQDEFYDIEEAEVSDEIARFSQSVIKVTDDLSNLAHRVSSEMNQALSDIFQAHIAMVQDPSLNADVKKEIETELVSAGSAIKSVYRRWALRFQRMEMEVAKQKADDIRDLARRLISTLAGVRAHALEQMPEGSILFAHRLLPSDTIYLARRNVSAAVLEYGGTSSHAALFAREIGLPCIAGIANLLERVPSGINALVDADASQVITRPDNDQQEAFDIKFQQLKKRRSNARVQALEPAITASGKVVSVYANVTCADDTRQAVNNGADGIGLYRIEQAFLGRQTPPDEETLTREIGKTLTPAKHLPVYVRLLDVGADKPLPFMETFRETNPSLGQRGIRFLRAYPDLLTTQLRVLLHLSTEFNIRILVPMVTYANDVQIVREQLEELAVELQVSPPKLGAMIETPAAALSLKKIADYADFMSFGTNDLTQYTFAADRENAGVEPYFNDAHEVIFRLLHIARQDLPDAELSICGELAGRPDNIAKLLQLGINTLSVAPPVIPAIKQAVRQFES